MEYFLRQWYRSFLRNELKDFQESLGHFHKTRRIWTVEDYTQQLVCWWKRTSYMAGRPTRRYTKHLFATNTVATEEGFVQFMKGDK